MRIFRDANHRGQEFQAGFKPDRRAMYWYSCFNGAWQIANNPQGCSFGYRDAAADPIGNLILDISGAYASGYRKAILYLPAGASPSGQTNYCMDHWNNLNPAKQSGFRGKFSTFLQKYNDFSVGIYINGHIQATTGTYLVGGVNGVITGTYGDGTAFNPRDGFHQWFAQQCIQPWIDCGIRFVFFDFLANRPWTLPGFRRCFKKLRMGGEAIPTTVFSSAPTPYKDVQNKNAWLTTDGFQGGTVDPTKSWYLNTRNTECYVVFQTVPTTSGEVIDYHCRGFIGMDYNNLNSGWILQFPPLGIGQSSGDIPDGGKGATGGTGGGGFGGGNFG